MMENDLSRFTVEQLKEKCRHHGLKVSGKKQELVERLNSNGFGQLVGLNHPNYIKPQMQHLHQHQHDHQKLHSSGLKRTLAPVAEETSSKKIKTSFSMPHMTDSLEQTPQHPYMMKAIEKFHLVPPYDLLATDDDWRVYYEERCYLANNPVDESANKYGENSDSNFDESSEDSHKDGRFTRKIKENAELTICGLVEEVRKDMAYFLNGIHITNTNINREENSVQNLDVSVRAYSPFAILLAVDFHYTTRSRQSFTDQFGDITCTIRDVKMMRQFIQNPLGYAEDKDAILCSRESVGNHGLKHQIFEETLYPCIAVLIATNPRKLANLGFLKSFEFLVSISGCGIYENHEIEWIMQKATTKWPLLLNETTRWRISNSDADLDQPDKDASICDSQDESDISDGRTGYEDYRDYRYTQSTSKWL